jgi:hypothetical protein
MADHSEEGQLPSPLLALQACIHPAPSARPRASYTLATKQFAKFLVDKPLTAATKETRCRLHRYRQPGRSLIAPAQRRILHSAP